MSGKNTAKELSLKQAPWKVSATAIRAIAYVASILDCNNYQALAKILSGDDKAYILLKQGLRKFKTNGSS
ncbi:MAG: hypothetical protein IIC69_03490 [Nanoarchaeota archaeon]|nr:hypothetical protein [Nanoarchaeota archaeon]